MTPDEMHGEISSSLSFFFFFLHFKTSLHLLQLFLRMPRLCFAVKLLKCFLDNETSPDIPGPRVE